MFSKFILNTLFLFSVLTAFSQTDTGGTMHTKVIKVKNKIYMIQANGGNIGLSFGNDGIFMVDAQYAEGIEQIQKEIRKISGKNKDSIKVQFLVNTHFHEDHVGGNIGMAKTGTAIFSQDNTRKRLQDMIKADKRKIPEQILPVITFAENLTFHYNNETIKIFHVKNAHTDGDAMVYFSDSNVLQTGDVFFNGKYPFIDVENGGSFEGVIAGLEKVLSEIDQETKIIPGHGDLASYEDVQNTIIMLGTIYKKVYTLYASKKTEDEVAKMRDLTKEYDMKGYGSGFITTEAFLRMLYKAVGKERSAIDSNAEKNRQAREKVAKMQKELEEKEKNAKKTEKQ